MQDGIRNPAWAIASCCKDCKDRYIGCHDASKCERWAAKTERENSIKAARRASNLGRFGFIDY